MKQQNRCYNTYGLKIQNFKTTVNPFSGNAIVNYYFNKSGMSQLIDNELGARTKYSGYQYSEILRNFTNVFFSGGGAIEDINTHFREHLQSIPGNNVPSADTDLEWMLVHTQKRLSM